MIAWCAASLFVLATFQSSGQRTGRGFGGGRAGRLGGDVPTAATHVPNSTTTVQGDGVWDHALPLVQRTGHVDATSIVQVAVGVAGGDFSSFRLFLKLGPSAQNVYAIYGTTETPLTVPPAYQCKSPFGTNIGGPSTHPDGYLSSDLITVCSLSSVIVCTLTFDCDVQARQVWQLLTVQVSDGPSGILGSQSARRSSCKTTCSARSVCRGPSGLSGHL